MVSGPLAVFQGYYFNRVRRIVGTHDQVAVRSFDVPDDASAVFRYGAYVTFALAVWSQRIIVAVEQQGGTGHRAGIRAHPPPVTFVGRYGAGNREVERSRKKAASHECSGGIHNPRGGAAARMYAGDGRAVPARCAGPALADPACGWFDGTITLSYGGSKTCPEGKNYNFDLSDTNQGGNIEKLALQPPLT